MVLRTPTIPKRTICQRAVIRRRSGRETTSCAPGNNSTGVCTSVKFAKNHSHRLKPPIDKNNPAHEKRVLHHSCNDDRKISLSRYHRTTGASLTVRDHIEQGVQGDGSPPAGVW